MTTQWIEVRCSECGRDLTEIFYPTEEFFHDHSCEEYAIHTHHEDGDREGMTAQWTEVHCMVCDKDLTEEFYPSVAPHDDFSIAQLTIVPHSLLPESESKGVPVTKRYTGALSMVHTPIRSRKYCQKISALLKTAGSYDQSLKTLIDQYEGQVLVNSEGLDKRFIFKMIILHKSTCEAFTAYCRTRLGHLDHNKEKNRTPEQYGLDLIVGWIGEDLLLNFLNQAGFEVALNAQDKSRDFSDDSMNITADADFQTIDPDLPNIMVKNDLTGYMRRSGCLDIKPGDYSLLESKKGIVIGVSENEMVCITDVSKHTVEHIPRHTKFNKPMVRIRLSSSAFMTFKDSLAYLKSMTTVK